MDWEMCCNLGSPLRPFSSANIFPSETSVFVVVVRVSEKKLWSLKVVVNASNGYFVFFTVFVLRERERERERDMCYVFITIVHQHVTPSTPPRHSLTLLLTATRFSFLIITRLLTSPFSLYSINLVIQITIMSFYTYKLIQSLIL
jgi:hypothetical protein